ncbi:MAG: hypothetical protein KJO49_06160, partial [Bacteroidia bacterium]|nr:hypothetical protein [Bacteroidia bacterium]
IIATLIAITPYLFYLYESVPETQVWNTFIFTFDAKSWEDMNYLMWVTTGKVIPLFLLTIWFFTCRHWWYHTILVPITMYVYQLFGMFDENLPYVDEFQLMHLVPVMAIIVPSIYLIRARMFNRMINVDKSMEELEEEFKIKPKSFLEKISDYF